MSLGPCLCAYRTTCWLGDVCHGRLVNDETRPGCYRSSLLDAVQKASGIEIWKGGYRDADGVGHGGKLVAAADRTPAPLVPRQAIPQELGL